MTGPENRAGQAPAVFLERQSYRRRRMMDFARLVPILGGALFAVPLLWPRAAEDGNGPVGAEATPMSGAILYIFAVWAALIVVTVLFGQGVRRWGGEGPGEGKD